MIGEDRMVQDCSLYSVDLIIQNDARHSMVAKVNGTVKLPSE